jgi:hypothetical protein
VSHVSKGLIEIEFIFKDAVNAFSQGVFVAVIVFSHTNGDVMSLKNLCVDIAAVLDTAVGVMYESVNVFSLVKGFIKGSNATTEFKAVTKVITDDLTRVSISDQSQVTKAFNGPDIGDITHPDLVGSGSFKILNDVMVLVEPV